MLYDIPHRAGTAIATETLLRLAEHPRVVAVKDAKSDLVASAAVMAASDLAYYSGDDALTLPLLSIGAVGVVGTSTHFCGPQAQRARARPPSPATRPRRCACTGGCCRSSRASSPPRARSWSRPGSSCRVAASAAYGCRWSRRPTSSGPRWPGRSTPPGLPSAPPAA